jgi:hypothetical protein
MKKLWQEMKERFYSWRKRKEYLKRIEEEFNARK